MFQLLTTLFLALSFTGHVQTKAMEINKPYTILVLMDATPEWLALGRTERAAFFEKEVMPIIGSVHKTVTLQMFDSEYFHASVSDFLILQTTKLEDYKLLIEQLRDSKVYSTPYFRIQNIIMGQETLFEDFNEHLQN